MQAIIIGAGRGIRLMPTTADAPKCFAQVGNRRILDWGLEAFHQAGIDRIVFVGGYQIDKVRSDYPHFTFRHNHDWENNNILASLFFAEDCMDEPFICCYSDTLFRPSVVKGLVENSSDMGVSIDTDWLSRYTHRLQHPSDDAEKVTVTNGLVTRIDRQIPEAEAYGEYTGVACFSKQGAKRLREHYHRCRERVADGPFREAATFKKAYFIHLLQEMVEAGEQLTHVDTPGGYIEIDTQEDFDYAQQHWNSA
jgi:choline kinase